MVVGWVHEVLHLLAVKRVLALLLVNLAAHCLGNKLTLDFRCRQEALESHRIEAPGFRELRLNSPNLLRTTRIRLVNLVPQVVLISEQLLDDSLGVLLSRLCLR